MGLIQLMPAVWFLLEPGLLFGRVIVPETGRLCFGDKFYITDKDERLKYGPREKGEVLQPDWGSRTPRNVPFIQQTFPEPTHSGWWVGAKRDTTTYFSKYFGKTAIYKLQILLFTVRRHPNRPALSWEDHSRGPFQLYKVRQTDTQCF